MVSVSLSLPLVSYLDAFIARPTQQNTQTHAIIRCGTMKENNSDQNHSHYEYRVLEHIRTCTPNKSNNKTNCTSTDKKNHFRIFKTLPINKPKTLTLHIISFLFGMSTTQTVRATKRTKQIETKK